MVHAVISIALTNHKPVIFSLHTWYVKKKKKFWSRLKCLLVRMISQKMPTQTSALCFILWLSCSVCFAGERVNRNTQTHIICWMSMEGGVKDGERRESIREFSFLMWCAECMWKPDPLCPSSPNKLCVIIWVLLCLHVSLFFLEQ